MMRSVRQLRHGFTLIELLVAVLILALISAAAYAAVDTILRSRNTLHQRALSLQAMQTAMSRFERDLRQALAAPVRDQYGELQPCLIGEATRIELTRAGLANPLAQTRARIERVQWLLQEQSWSRLHYAVLDRAVNSQPGVVPMLSGVEKITLTYFDGTQWRNQWPRSDASNQTSQQLPRAVALEMETTEYGRIRRVIALAQAGATAQPQGIGP